MSDAIRRDLCPLPDLLAHARFDLMVDAALFGPSARSKVERHGMLWQDGGGSWLQVVLLAGDRVRYANPACAEAFGRPVESMPGLPVQALVAEDDVPLLREWLRAALMPGQSPDAAVRTPRMRRSDGSLFNAALTAAETRYEDAICTVVVMRDLSDAERMRDELVAGNQQLQAMAARIFSVQEDERRRISRDLHDDIGQSITAIKMSASAAMDEDDPARRHDDLDDVLALADATLSRLRDISILLRPPQLDALGLEAALRWHAERLFAHAGVDLDLAIAALPRRPGREQRGPGGEGRVCGERPGRAPILGR